jgi:tRNA(fMet)-specific endonuclease VapC
MKFLLDTNVCVDYLNGRHPAVTRAIQRASPDDLCISSVAVAELRYGAGKSAGRLRSAMHS